MKVTGRQGGKCSKFPPIFLQKARIYAGLSYIFAPNFIRPILPILSRMKKRPGKNGFLGLFLGGYSAFGKRLLRSRKRCSFGQFAVGGCAPFGRTASPLRGAKRVPFAQAAEALVAPSPLFPPSRWAGGTATPSADRRVRTPS